MKTWEIMQHSGKEFKRKSDGLMMEITEDGTLNWLSGYMHLNINDEWEEVKELVSFMEAVKSGRQIKVEHKLIDDLLKAYFFTIPQELNDFIWNLGDTFSTEEIATILQEGEFYIED